MGSGCSYRPGFNKSLLLYKTPKPDDTTTSVLIVTNHTDADAHSQLYQIALRAINGNYQKFRKETLRIW